MAAHAQQKSFYDFTVKTIDGEDLSLSTLTYDKFRGLLYLSFSESGEKVIYPTNQINYNNSSYDHCNDTT